MNKNGRAALRRAVLVSLPMTLIGTGCASLIPPFGTGKGVTVINMSFVKDARGQCRAKPMQDTASASEATQDALMLHLINRCGETLDVTLKQGKVLTHPVICAPALNSKFSVKVWKGVVCTVRYGSIPMTEGASKNADESVMGYRGYELREEPPVPGRAASELVLDEVPPDRR